MVLILTILSLILNGYLFYLLKKLTKETDIYISEIKTHYETLINEKSLYLLDEINNKFKSNKELLLNKLKETNIENQKDNNKNHEQLISNEFKKLRSDINKDLDDIVESVKNIKVF